ncbi:hypothetical protein [Yeguia hominis]|uniref:Uncharacterized protein n=1 Tax=Yeguia hominis TaxID=2763662 RepID=A0A926D7J0_9FIRM|nr:hypothetical protein [Yeguia hominis]MBC8532858.1 hypothetical protein [Yeguia hominis]
MQHGRSGATEKRRDRATGELLLLYNAQSRKPGGMQRDSGRADPGTHARCAFPSVKRRRNAAHHGCRMRMAQRGSARTAG